MSGALERSYTLDEAGNVTGDGVHRYGWGARNRLFSVDATLAKYVHNGLGQRVSKTVNGVTTYQLTDAQARVLGEYDDAAALHETVYLGDVPVVVL